MDHTEKNNEISSTDDANCRHRERGPASQKTTAKNEITAPNARGRSNVTTFKVVRPILTIVRSIIVFGLGHPRISTSISLPRDISIVCCSHGREPKTPVPPSHGDAHCGGVSKVRPTRTDQGPAFGVEPLHCAWCAARLQLVEDYKAWQQQDAAKK
jgi:hypothetical protein